MFARLKRLWCEHEKLKVLNVRPTRAGNRFAECVKCKFITLVPGQPIQKRALTQSELIQELANSKMAESFNQ